MKPVDESALAEMLAGATKPLAITGGATRNIGTRNGDPLYTAALSGITLYEPEALTLVAKAGTPVAEIEKLLAENKQQLPFEPMDYRALQGTSGVPTIGGVVATNASGPRRIQAGACRDSLIGVRFVDGIGRIIKNGGRVMKNVTGYDLVKLMAGSHGTLGVLSEVSFKVQPVAETRATVLVENKNDTDGVACMAAALNTPFDVNGAAHIGGLTALRIEGLDGSVSYRAAALAAHLGGQVGTFDWAGLRDVTQFSTQSGDVWRLSVKPGDGPAIANAARQAGATEVIFDWAGGLLWVLAPNGTDIRAAMGTTPGHATLIRGTAFPTFQPEPIPIANLTQGLRTAFDPRGILNPGMMPC